MSTIIYEIMGSLLSLLHTYVIFRLMRIFNKSNLYNKRTELISYIACIIFNYLMMKITDLTVVILITNFLFLFAVSFNYRSRINIKLMSVVITVAVTSLSEIITAFFLQISLSRIAVAEEATFHAFMYCRIIDLTTLALFYRLEDPKEAAKRKNSNIYLPVLLALVAVAIEINMLSGVLDGRHIAFNLLLITYIIYAFIHLHATEKMKIEAERKAMQQQIDNFRDQYDQIQNPPYPGGAKLYEVEPHFMAIRELAENNENARLLDYIEKLIITQRDKEKLIRTGNLTVDSIINTKFAEARMKGIIVEHDIFIPPNLNVDDVDMTTILTVLLNGAIKALGFHTDNKLFFYMKFMKNSLLHINMSHADTAAPDARNSSRYAFASEAAMNSVVRVAAKYGGGAETASDRGEVTVSLLLFVDKRD